MNHEEGTIIDTESIRRSLGDVAFQALDNRLRDEWSAKCYYFKQRQERIRAASDRLRLQANHKAGIFPTVKLDPWAFAWLQKYYPGWQQDPSFEKDLIRHHPEVAVKLEKRGNRVGWTPAVAGPSKPAARSITLTDKRGNAA